MKGGERNREGRKRQGWKEERDREDKMGGKRVKKKMTGR